MESIKTLIVGAGAIGGTLAVLLNCAGFKTDVLEISPGASSKIKKDGISLTGVKGNHKAYPEAFGSPSEIKDKYDIVIICVKYNHLTEAAESILPYLKENSIVMGMQNGICTEELSNVVGKSRAAGCMIGFGATKLSETEVNMTSGGEMYIGMLDGSVPPLLTSLESMYKSVVKTKITTDLLPRQFSKLIINCCINAVAAITGKTLGEILDDKRAQDLFLAIAREALSISDAMGLKVPKYGLLLDYRFLRLGNSKAYNSLCKIVVKMVGKIKYADVKPSTLQSLLRGEKTEIDIFNGYLVREAEKLSVPAPVNKQLTDMIREIENGERKMTPDNLSEIKI